MKYIIVILFSFLFLSCYTSAPRTYRSGDIECIYSENNMFAQINMDRRTFVVNGDSTVFNEMRFHCVGGAMKTKQIMFDNHGRWDQAVYHDGKQHPMLVWENVDFLKNSSEYDVFADGIESRNLSYSSVMIFDEQNHDVLSQQSVELDTLSNYFMTLVKMKVDSSEFYEQYWKMVDPQHWEKLKRIKNDIKNREKAEWPWSDK